MQYLQGQSNKTYLQYLQGQSHKTNLQYLQGQSQHTALSTKQLALLTGTIVYANFDDGMEFNLYAVRHFL